MHRYKFPVVYIYIYILYYDNVQCLCKLKLHSYDTRLFINIYHAYRTNNDVILTNGFFLGRCWFLSKQKRGNFDGSCSIISILSRPRSDVWKTSRNPSLFTYIYKYVNRTYAYFRRLNRPETPREYLILTVFTVYNIHGRFYPPPLNPVNSPFSFCRPRL